MRTMLLLLGMQASAGFAAPFTAHVDVAIGAQQWVYTVHNDSSVGDNIWISNFTLVVGASVVVAGVPGGWDYLTDGLTYVTWFNADIDPLFPNDIAPGVALGGFVIVSAAEQSLLSAADLGTWNHTLDQPEQSFSSLALSPLSGVPEPSTTVCVALALGGIVLLRSRR